MAKRSDYGVVQPVGQSLAVADLLSAVRAAAEELAAALRRAEQLTQGWAASRQTYELVDEAMTQCLARLAATGCRGEANRVPSGDLWRIAGHWLGCGELQTHAREKPRGYAGDYRMLSMIEREYCCQHPLGAAFDRYFQNHAAPRAVRARSRLVASQIAEYCAGLPAEPIHLVSVGTGPGMDVERAIRLLPLDRQQTIRVTLMDMDPEALDDARNRLLQHLKPVQIICRQINLFRLAERSDQVSPGPADLLICPGLFDYLADAPAAQMLRFFRKQLTNGGRLLVGNFVPENPSRAYMEWVGNWYLTYRSADQMKQLAVNSGFSKNQFELVTESVGVDLFIRATNG